jgi:hypothetical protein
MHEAIDIASSIACVAPFPEAGRYECAASPIWITRAPGDVQLGCGLRQRSSKLTMVFGGVTLTRSAKMEAHLCFSIPGILSIPSSTSSFSMVLLQLSFSVPVTCGCQLGT